MNKKEALLNYTLRLGDNALVLGHRLSEWCSNGPLLEEDLALTNMALDMIGRAQALLDYAGKIEGAGKTADDYAYRRAERKFYNNLITELPNKDFAFTIARQLVFSVFELYFYESLAEKKDEQLAAIAEKTLKEIRYHVEHATEWTMRLGEGTEESYTRIQKAINDIWMYTGELFEMAPEDELLLSENVAVDLPAIRIKWRKHIAQVLDESNVFVPEDKFMQTGSRAGIHTEYLGHILSEMQYLQRAYPDAKW